MKRASKAYYLRLRDVPMSKETERGTVPQMCLVDVICKLGQLYSLLRPCYGSVVTNQ